MKTIRLLLATGLALAGLVVVVGALTWSHPVTARAEDAVSAPVAPQALPMPWLSDDDVADAPFHQAPKVDGHINPGEYAGAGKVTFPGFGGEAEVFFSESSTDLHVAFELPDKTHPDPYVLLLLDTNHDGGSSPQTDDFRFQVARDGVVREYQGSGTTWIQNTPITWTYGVTETMTGWSVEFSIPFSKLGIVKNTFQVLGLGLAMGDWGAGPLHGWPNGAISNQPDSWGALVSSSDWSTLYWKPGPWEDYAPSGMPDFDQGQVGLTFCGPFAVANSLWWFDAKFEPEPVGPPPGGPIPVNDGYPLVHPYGLWDDHDPQNVVPLAMDLSTYFLTDQTVQGTHIYDMYWGIQDYLRDRGLWDEYVVTLVEQPDFFWIAEEVMRSEDVVLLLGLWEEQPPASGNWVRIGGHFVTVAGVDPVGTMLALSDPAQDFAETSGVGRVDDGYLIPHTPGHGFGIHNDAGNVSHDLYGVLPGSESPGGTWWIPEYEVPFFMFDLPGVNPNPRWEEPPLPWMGGMIHTEIEYALAVSPFTWKASGRWAEAEDMPPYHRRFEPFDDFAPSGVPDFDQRQDEWGAPEPPPWTHDGPVAAANSLWWFDSKFEYHGATPPAITDTYPLVRAYSDAWDDHDPQNVGNNGTGVGLVEDLATRFGTDTGAPGTLNTMLASGLELYLVEHDLRPGYVITQVDAPDFWWVAEEVERSEDVILLLGFWQWADLRWQRVGGHYVTVPGVDKQGGFVAFSDPYWDRMETALPPREFAGQPQWTGRVGSDGDPLLGPSGLLPAYAHQPLPHTGVYTLHNDAANVSHDVYAVVGTDSPGGTWGPMGYVPDTLEIENFVGLNGESMGFEPGLPVQTEVEWAVAVSPVAEVGILKSVTPDTVRPGDWVTFTIMFGNGGNTAESVVVSDTLPTGLINTSYTYTLDFDGTLVGHGAYTWTVGALHRYQGGVITVTAQVDPDFDWPEETVFTNTVEIDTPTVEQFQIPNLPNSSSALLTVLNPVVYGVNVTPDTDNKVGNNGATVAYDFSVKNTGNVSDSFSLSLANDNWPTVLSTGSVGPLDPNASTSIQVSVTVPMTAVGTTFDRATVTAQSVTSSTVSDTSVFTTTNLGRYDMHMEPASASLTDNQGETVTYTLVIYNDGNLTDTYDLAHTLATWSTSLSTAAVGPLAPWSNGSFQVHVTIPGGALDGASDVVTVTADSRNSTAVDDAVLTTVATSQPITRGVGIAPHGATGTGDPGETVTHTMRVTNTGTVADVIGLSHTGPTTWTVCYSANPLSLGAGVGTDVEVYVGIPAGAPTGSTGLITITATTQGSPPKTDTMVLTVNVSQRNIYLPLVMRNYSSP